MEHFSSSDVKTMTVMFRRWPLPIAIKEKCGRDSAIYNKTYSALKKRFHVKKIKHLPSGCYDEALALIQAC